MNFNTALESWTRRINEYDIFTNGSEPRALVDEVAEAYEDAFIGREAYDGRLYIDVFIRNSPHDYRDWLDSADEDRLIDQILENRGAET